MKVAILTPCVLYGGAEQWCRNLARGLIALGHQCEVVTFVNDLGVSEKADAWMREVVPLTRLAEADAPKHLENSDAIIAWGLPQLQKLVAGTTCPLYAVSHGDDLDWTLLHSAERAGSIPAHRISWQSAERQLLLFANCSAILTSR